MAISPKADAQVKALLVAGGKVAFHGAVVGQFVVKAELAELDGGFFIALPIPP